MDINHIRKYIFSFLRNKPKKICRNCNKCLIWDHKVNNYKKIYINKINNFYIYICYVCFYENSFDIDFFF